MDLSALVNPHGYTTGPEIPVYQDATAKPIIHVGQLKHDIFARDREKVNGLLGFGTSGNINSSHARRRPMPSLT